MRSRDSLAKIVSPRLSDKALSQNTIEEATLTLISGIDTHMYTCISLGTHTYYTRHTCPLIYTPNIHAPIYTLCIYTHRQHTHTCTLYIHTQTYYTHIHYTHVHTHSHVYRIHI